MSKSYRLPKWNGAGQKHEKVDTSLFPFFSASVNWGSSRMVENASMIPEGWFLKNTKSDADQAMHVRTKVAADCRLF
jgi:hypothetical protein